MQHMCDITTTSYNSCMCLCYILYNSSGQIFCVVSQLTQGQKSCMQFFHIQFCYIFFSSLLFACVVQGHRDLVNVKPYLLPVCCWPGEWVFDIGQWNSIDLLWAFPFRSFKIHSLLCLTSKWDSIKIHTAEIYQQPLNDKVNLAQSRVFLLLFYASVTLWKVEIHLI